MAHAKLEQVFLLISIINTIKILSNDFLFLFCIIQKRKKTLTIMPCVYYSCVINKRKKLFLITNDVEEKKNVKHR